MPARSPAEPRTALLSSRPSFALRQIKDVEEELGISYPTVVARLNECSSPSVRAGEDPRDAERRQRVLDELSAGRLTASEAAEQLRALGSRDG